MPISDLDAYDRRCLDLIAKHGWMVQAVFPTERDKQAPYSSGGDL